MAQLLTNVWKVDVLTNHLYEVAAKVQTSLASTDEQDAAAYMSRVANFSRRIERRIRVLRRELQPPANTDAALDPTGLLLLTGWRPQTDIGDPVLQKDEQDPNRPLLSIVAEDSCAASWRCTVVLDEGRYHFEGRLRLEGVKFGDRDPKTGAGLRISRSRFAKKLTADCPWTPVTFEFEVQQAQTPVELVCELRASEGKAWFDQRSLRLRRLE
jgi:hypothetical protein